MEVLESLIEELQTSVRKVVPTPPANYVRVHELTGGYSNGAGQLGSSIFRDNMNEIEKLMAQLDELEKSYVAVDGAPQSMRNPPGPSFTLESLMNDLKEFQIEQEVAQHSGSSPGGNRLAGATRDRKSQQQQSPQMSPGSTSVSTSSAYSNTAAHTAFSPKTPASPPSSAAAAAASSGASSAKSGGTRCAGCQEQIQGQMVHALGRIWHLEHFLCAGCQSELGQQTFYEMSGLAYCEPCYQAAFSPKCAQCSGPILDRCVTALGKQWHPEHFFCHQCTAPFSETCGFHERGGWPYCIDCYSEAFSPKCHGCSAPITSNYVTALDRMWHPECFACKDCGRDLGDGATFYELSGRPYCELHYHANKGTLCITCERPIASQCITALGCKFHPECFKCAFCNNLLSRGTFKEKESKPYCTECYSKLFRKK